MGYGYWTSRIGEKSIYEVEDELKRYYAVQEKNNEVNHDEY